MEGVDTHHHQIVIAVTVAVGVDEEYQDVQSTVVCYLFDNLV